MSAIKELALQTGQDLPIPTEQMIQHKEISGTPFRVTSIGNDHHFISMSNVKYSQTFEDAEEAKQWFYANMVSIIIQACATISQTQINDHLNKQL